MYQITEEYNISVTSPNRLTEKRTKVRNILTKNASEVVITFIRRKISKNLRII